MSRFSPLSTFADCPEKGHGRIEQRSIEVLPAKAAGIEKEWPAVESICRVTRLRQGKKNGEWKDPEEEVVYLIASLPAGETAPDALLSANRGHWGIEIMHRSKNVILGEDDYTNRSDNAPRNIFSLIGVRVAGAANIILREAIGVGQSISRRAFQVGRGSAGFNPLGAGCPLAASDGVFLARFLEVLSPFEGGKDQPQFRFLNEI
jgi:hypothetical protein